jgi:hypothetical protein
MKPQGIPQSQSSRERDTRELIRRPGIVQQLSKPSGRINCMTDSVAQTQQLHSRDGADQPICAALARSCERTAGIRLVL